MNSQFLEIISINAIKYLKQLFSPLISRILIIQLLFPEKIALILLDKPITNYIAKIVLLI